MLELARAQAKKGRSHTAIVIEARGIELEMECARIALLLELLT